MVLNIYFDSVKSIEAYRDKLSCSDMTNTTGSYVLIIKFYASFLVSNVDTPGIFTFCACEIAEIKRSIGWRGIGNHEEIIRTLNIEL